MKIVFEINDKGIESMCLNKKGQVVNIISTSMQVDVLKTATLPIGSFKVGDKLTFTAESKEIFKAKINSIQLEGAE